MTAMGSGRSYAHAVAIQDDRKIVAAGQTQVGRGNNYDFGLTRYNSNGTLDVSCGNDGKVTTSFESGPAVANALAIQSDGRIMAAGYARADGLSHFALARYQVASTGSQTIAEGASATFWRA